MLARSIGRVRKVNTRSPCLPSCRSSTPNASSFNGTAIALRAFAWSGWIIASALVGSLGDGRAFDNGREFAASLGLTPRQHSTGGRVRLLGSSKRGDPYLRKLLVHGARAVLYHAKNKDDALSQWANRLLARKHANVATVALANKTARVAWAMVRNGVEYQPNLIAAAPTPVS